MPSPWIRPSSLLLLGLVGALAWPQSLRAQGIPPNGLAAPEAGPFTDDGDPESLRLAVRRTLTYLQSLRAPHLRVAGRTLSVARLRTTCEEFLSLLDEKLSPAEFEQALKERFEFLDAPGHDGAGSMHLTGYHLPLLEARRRPDATFRFPVYGMPPTVVANLGRFKPALAGQSVRGMVRGGELMPMPTRSDIDDKKALAGMGLELAYVADELGRNAVMVQGSGLLRFEDGRIENLNYAGQNGHPYVSLGTALVRDGVMQSQGLTYPKIEAYFAAHPEKLHAYLGRNLSYVFFKLAAEGPFGCTGVAVVPGRSIATDQGHYPGGLIGHLSYPRAAFGPGGVPLNWGLGGRFVAGHDTGGAIRGPGRIDVYWGGGQEAAWRAGTMNGPGRWRILLWRESPPKPEPSPHASPLPPMSIISPASEGQAPPASPTGHAPILDQVTAPPTKGPSHTAPAEAPPRPPAPPLPRALPTPGGFLPLGLDSPSPISPAATPTRAEGIRPNPILAPRLIASTAPHRRSPALQPTPKPLRHSPSPSIKPKQNSLPQVRRSPSPTTRPPARPFPLSSSMPLRPLASSIAPSIKPTTGRSTQNPSRTRPTSPRPR